MKYAIVKDNKTVNIIEYDGSEPLEVDGTLIEAIDSTYIGGVYSNGVFEDKPIPEDTRTYVEFRQKQYAPTGDQLDMLWHSIDAGEFGDTAKQSEFYTANKAVKDAFPKG
jgi:hypothetical protein